MKILSVDFLKCTGCRMCELECALRHFKKVNPKKGAIRITSLFPDPIANIPIFCRHCNDPPCLSECPVQALYKTEDGRVVLDKTKCIECRVCADVCPIGAIFFHHDLNYPIMCDLCGGDPACVKRCPTGALLFVSKTRIGQSRRSHIAQKLAVKEGL